MDDLLKPLRTTRTAKHGIAKFESLSSSAASHNKQQSNSLKPSSTRKVSIKLGNISLEEKEEEDALLKPITTIKTSHHSSRPTENSLHPASSDFQTVTTTTTTEFKINANADTKYTVNRNRNRKRDSTAFLQHSYLPLDQTPASIKGTSLVDDAREILKSQPTQSDLLAVLEYLTHGIKGDHDFNVKCTGPQSAQIVNVLVTTTVGDIWPNLRAREVSLDEARLRKALVACLTSVAGVGALVAHIRVLSNEGAVSGNRSGNGSASASGHEAVKARLCDALCVLGEVLGGSRVVYAFLQDVNGLYTQDVQRRLCWLELVTLLAGGRVLSTAAQGLSAVDAGQDMFKKVAWLGSGREYSRWLASNISHAAVKVQPADAVSWTPLAQMLKRALSLGQRESLIAELYESLLLGSHALWTPMHQLLQGLSALDQMTVFDCILLDVSRRCFGGSSLPSFEQNDQLKQAIAAAAALIAGLVKNNEVLEEHLEEWLVVANASYATIGLATRRSLIAVLARSEAKLERILERSLTNFADKLQIQHASSMQQQAYAQTILLAVAYLTRIDRTILKRPHISSLVLRSVSNRLAASVPQARFLGMIVGVAVSRVVDAPDKVLDFGVEDMESEEAQNWLRIVDVFDDVASDIETDKLFTSVSTAAMSSRKASKHNAVKTENRVQLKSVTPVASKVLSIEEVSDYDSDEEDDDLIPYSKPDSDPEDSDDDPTLIDRSRPSAPVYIKDLITQLQTDNKPDTVALALKTAPSLIKRKTGFGSELSENINALTTTLVNLQDGDGIPEADFASLRLQSLIACVVAKPDTIAPALAALYFEGDFSVSQRVTILTTLGLSVRQLAGFQDSLVDPSSSETLSAPDDSFPSKRLPAHLEPSSPSSFSTSPSLKPISQAQASNPISALTLSSAHSIIRPMALAAADKMTGPSVLKIRTFSSRMEVEKQRKEKHEARTKIVPQNLHILLVKGFYMELCGRMGPLVSSLSSGIGSNSSFGVGSSSRNTGRFNSTIVSSGQMSLFLQTLTLILNTMGPSASLHLPALTHETLLLLLALHNVAGLATDPVVLPALLYLLLALIDITIEAGVTAQERLITDHGMQIAELVNWSNSLGDKIAVPDISKSVDGGASGAMPWTVLAAGIQVKWFEVGKRFQGRMLGLQGDEFDGA